MDLTLWTYEGPPHVGAMRVVTGMRGVHLVLHAPQGDTYADLLFTMIERRGERPPVTYTTFEARDLGADTAEVFKNAVRDAYERFDPQAIVVGASCTAELLQDDPGGLARALDLPVPVVPLELSAYRKKENWGAAETFYRIARTLAAPKRERERTAAPALQPARPHRARIPPSRRRGRDRPPSRGARGRNRRDRAVRRVRRGHLAARGGRLQRRPLSRGRASDRAVAREDPRAALHADRSNRRRGDARRSWPRSPSLPGSIPTAPGAKETRVFRGGRGRSTRPI